MMILQRRQMNLVMMTALAGFFAGAPTAFGECPPGNCKPYGTCQLDQRGCGDDCQERCICQDGFAGRDCSFPVDICPDDVNDSGARACFNNGKCYSTPNADGNSVEWKCDCSAAFGDSLNYQGTQCEFPKEIVSCENGKKNSDYAFCVNGGTCGDNMVEPGEFFHGCTCSHLFEGRHCQFPAGTAPKREMILYPTKSNGMRGGSIFFVVLIALAGTAGMAFWAVRSRRRRRAARHFSTKPNASHSHMDYEDGELQLEEVDVNDDQPPASLSPSRGGATIQEREFI